jgi:hypothetical protein
MMMALSLRFGYRGIAISLRVLALFRLGGQAWPIPS